MSLLDKLAALSEAKKALAEAEEVRRDKTRQALIKATKQALDIGYVHAAEDNLDAVLAASSQANAIRGIIKALGLGEMVKGFIGGLIDRLEGGK